MSANEPDDSCCSARRGGQYCQHLWHQLAQVGELVARGDKYNDRDVERRQSPENLFIEGNNLTATKARLLLTAAIMKLGALPPVADPERPTREELDAIRKCIAAYQEIFQTH